MPRLLASFVLATATLILGHGLPAAAQDGAAVQIELRNGETWRGAIGVEVTVAYTQRGLKKTLTGTLADVDANWVKVTDQAGRTLPIFKADITGITTAGASEEEASEPTTDTEPTDTAEPDDTTAADDDAEDANDSGARPTFFLPLTGMVGEEFRPEEIEEITRQADEYGPGQTIVLHINSGGGYVAEWILIRDAIYEAQKRHRMVAWVKDATSAAASTSLCCDVIVFETDGHLGSITTLSGGGSLPWPQQVASADRYLVPVLEKSRRSPLFAVPFKTGQAGSRSLLSFSKDPDTGDVTFYNDLNGDHVLNRAGEVLTVNTWEAIECGLAIGVADSKEELGQLIHQGGWNEVGTGQELHDDWKETVRRCKEYLRKSNVEMGKLGNSIADIRKRIKILKKYLQWWRDAANVCMGMGLPPAERIEMMIEQLEEEIRERMRAG